MAQSLMIRTSNDVLGPSFQAVPEFLAEKKYQNPTQLTDAPFQKAWKTDEPLWTWLHKRPKETAIFNRFMYAQRSSMNNCFSFLPIDKECENWPTDRPVFVDIGGGTGQQCAAIKEKFPDLPGKVILQDLPAVVAEAKLPEDIETMAYDFFTPQPVKGKQSLALRPCAVCCLFGSDLK
jgi:demethylsterigmatocystin 6-O-methyltransferase